jgi:hypothetical protein
VLRAGVIGIVDRLLNVANSIINNIGMSQLAGGDSRPNNRAVE